MFCKNCGKEIANDAFMCPNCGSPASAPAEKQAASPNTEGSSVPLVAFILSLIAFVMAPFVGAAFFICNNGFTIMLSSIALILITLCGFVFSLFAVARVHNQSVRAKVFSILSVVFTGVVLLLLFVCLVIFIFI